MTWVYRAQGSKHVKKVAAYSLEKRVNVLCCKQTSLQKNIRSILNNHLMQLLNILKAFSVFQLDSNVPTLTETFCTADAMSKPCDRVSLLCHGSDEVKQC